MPSPLEMAIYARRSWIPTMPDAVVFIPNINASERKAVEKFNEAFERKKGTRLERGAPLTTFPVSTNNVIYIPDIVLKGNQRVRAY